MTEEVVVDKQYQIHRHAVVTDAQPFVKAMKSAAERAYAAAYAEKRTPVMVEIIVYVAPEPGA
ncbi:hypothetical protein [Burkholderia multivorans]|uniref:hypothetical protein n=1 Tax=Burkholderia multivorans TaxID=87883 RepID=UPI000753C182|nr:hypothetical protein [Burkholderia multivorans]KVT46699.1 hypothetical protein WK52_00075 [Burkholderia multivorans]MBR8020761.1 hypothetical protein [Burkholderia multivorans]MBU9227312.1 hypothetical protein [Burkholderia multivorans]MBU9388507.1 hypothetical protein [Burkholderia multivorans]MDN8032919.1 hypothetical protein [Burkholderia multivorans]